MLNASINCVIRRECKLRVHLPYTPVKVANCIWLISHKHQRGIFRSASVDLSDGNYITGSRKNYAD